MEKKSHNIPVVSIILSKYYVVMLFPEDFSVITERSYMFLPIAFYETESRIIFWRYDAITWASEYELLVAKLIMCRDQIS
jgi:hypothetical protein